MDFQNKVTVVGGATGPDPIGAPQDVPDSLLCVIPKRSPFADTPTLSNFGSLDGLPGETVTVELWALDDSTTPKDPNERTPATQAARKFYQVPTAGPLVLASHVMSQLSVPSGTLYIRPIADAIVPTESREVRITSA